MNLPRAVTPDIHGTVDNGIPYLARIYINPRVSWQNLGNKSGPATLPHHHENPGTFSTHFSGSFRCSRDPEFSDAIAVVRSMGVSRRDRG